MKVRTAWFDAIDSHQSNGRRGVAMGLVRNDGVTNANDYFCDIANNTIGYWYYTFVS